MGSCLDRIGDWAARARKVKYSVAGLARNVGVSRRQLDRYFLHVFEKCPKQWLNQLRMEDALRKARRGKSVKTAALEVGYKHDTHFCRAFRRARGHAVGAELSRHIVQWPGDVPKRS